MKPPTGGGVSLLVSVATYLFLTFTCSADGACIRQPEGVRIPKTPGDNGYRLKISGNPEQYVPGEVYTGKFCIQFQVNFDAAERDFSRS